MCNCSAHVDTICNLFSGGLVSPGATCSFTTCTLLCWCLSAALQADKDTTKQQEQSIFDYPVKWYGTIKTVLLSHWLVHKRLWRLDGVWIRRESRHIYRCHVNKMLHIRSAPKCRAVISQFRFSLTGLCVFFRYSQSGCSSSVLWKLLKVHKKLKCIVVWNKGCQQNKF